MRSTARIALIAGLLGSIAGCGGGSGGTFAGIGGGAGGGSGMNTLAVTVDAGPQAAGGAVNTLYTTVTICAPGSTNQCQTIDHVQVDTGSTGLRVIASVLGAGILPAQLPQASDTNGYPLDECAQFADGYSWGTVRTADLLIGNSTAAAVPVQVIGDAAAGPVPASCVSGPLENTVPALGANAILGIGNFLTDCGTACETSAVPGAYYACPVGGSCLSVALPVDDQIKNPVALFTADNNGVVIDLPSVSAPTATVTGTLTFGIGTQADNAFPAAAQIYAVDPNYGTLTTLYNGGTFGASFIDAGSNAYFFTDDTIPTCVDQPSFYCPGSTLGLGAVIQGVNGASANVAFAVDNADSNFATGFAALPNLAGPAGTAAANAFDWGLPFFYGRPVYVAFESNVAAGVAGPWIGF